MNTEKITGRPFTVITQHGLERTVRRRRFATYEEALAYAESFDPMTDGSVCPNVDTKYADTVKYERGVFWHGNRYAVIHNAAHTTY